MKTQPQIKRVWLERSDGQLRWAQAYQLILRWSTEQQQHPTTETILEEKQDDATGIVRASVDEPTTAATDN